MRGSLANLLMLSVLQLAWFLTGPRSTDALLAGGLVLAMGMVRAIRQLEPGARPGGWGRWMVLIALPCALAASMLLWPGSTPIRGAAMAFLLLVGLAAPAVVTLRLSRRGTIDLALLFGAASVYLLLGMSFAMTYALVHLVDPASHTNLGGSSTGGFRELVYFSYVTLATTGYGDIVPASGLARTLAILESIGGQLYLIIAMTTVVSMLTQRQQRGS